MHIIFGSDMENKQKLLKNNHEGENKHSLSFLNNKKTIATAVIAVSLLGTLRPAEKPVNAHMNPIVRGLIQGAVEGAAIGVANGINYSVARQYGGYGGYYQGYGGYQQYVAPAVPYQYYQPQQYGGYGGYQQYVAPAVPYQYYQPQQYVAPAVPQYVAPAVPYQYYQPQSYVAPAVPQYVAPAVAYQFNEQKPYVAPAVPQYVAPAVPYHYVPNYEKKHIQHAVPYERPQHIRTAPNKIYRRPVGYVQPEQHNTQQIQSSEIIAQNATTQPLKLIKRTDTSNTQHVKNASSLNEGANGVILASAVIASGLFFASIKKIKRNNQENVF